MIKKIIRMSIWAMPVLYICQFFLWHSWYSQGKFLPAGSNIVFENQTLWAYNTKPYMTIEAIFQCPIGQPSNKKINANAEILFKNNQILYLYFKPIASDWKNFNCNDTLKQTITLFEYDSIKGISLNEIQQVNLKLQQPILDYKITLINAKL